MSGLMDLNEWVQEERAAGRSREEVRSALALALKRAPAAEKAMTWPDPAWPVLAPAALHGLAGDVVRAILPATEADAPALLFTFLSAFGNAMGPRAGAFADGAWHPARIWPLIVGRTARSRKSTARAHIQNVMRLADPEWLKDNRVRNLSTGEGLIDAIIARDPDKRLWVSAAEFSRVLRVSTREGNTLVDVMIEAWDGEVLEILTAANPRNVAGAHVSVLGLITADTLKRRLTDEQLASGFANRFLTVLVQRSKKLPSPPELDYTAIADPVERVLKSTRKRGRMQRTSDAEELWSEIYKGLPDAPGLFGELTARAEAHMLRLQVLYAAADGTGRIQPVHVAAAKAAWDYAEASARYLFGDRTGDGRADDLLTKLRDVYPEGLSHEEQREAFGRNVAGAELHAARRRLIELGLVEESTVRTRGRPKSVSRAVAR